MDIEKLIERLRQHGVTYMRAYGRYCSICNEVIATLSTLQAENEKMCAELKQVKAERDAAVSDLTFVVNKYRLFTTDINLCYLCKFNFPSSGENEQTYECPGCYGDDCFEWRGQKITQLLEVQE